MPLPSNVLCRMVIRRQTRFRRTGMVRLCGPPGRRRPKFTPDHEIALQEFPFASNPISVKSSYRTLCKTTAELLSSLHQQYGPTNDEDELHFETQLVFMRKQLNRRTHGPVQITDCRRSDHLHRFPCVAFHGIPTGIITEGMESQSVKCCLLGFA